MSKKRDTQSFNRNLDLPRSESFGDEISVKHKKGHDKLPFFILPNHNILVFTQSPIYKKVYHHLKSIAEPIYRPKSMHQYAITKFSLYTAMVLHYTGEEIVKILQRLSKNQQFPKSLEQFILQYMKYAGQVRFSLIQGSYYVFTTQKISLFIDQFLEKGEQVQLKEIYNYHLDQISEDIQHFQQQDEINRLEDDPQVFVDAQKEFQQEEIIQKKQEKPVQNEVFKQKTMLKFKVKGDYFQVTKRLIERNIPLVQQFDFKNCKQLPDIQIDLNSDVKLRFYQEAALQNVFIGGKARSGLIILPCGAGKSMVAIAVVQRIKKKAIIFCQNQTSAIQWKDEFIRWTTIQRNKIVVLTSKYKNTTLKQIENCSIFITTYTMVGLKRDKQNPLLQKTQKLDWGVCIADEVHKLPAQTFQMVLQKYKFYLKLGLTATPYRQDKKIDNLYYMVGPKLYQQNWLDLVNQGCLAKPYCVQILCKMTPLFKECYQNLNRAELIHTANPQKFKVLQYLIKKHTHFGDKILVFCDRPKILEKYAKMLKKPFIHGNVSEQERLHFYGAFKTIKQFNVLFLSRVGDTAIDLPCANVGIQIGMHHSSRRQQVQRMGRIMRPKDNPFNEFNAFFYTLVSEDTTEALNSRQRQKILVDQGFQYQLKMGQDLNYTGISIQHLDEKDHLNYVLSQHQQGDILLSKGGLQDKRKEATIKQGRLAQYNDYYYQQNSEE